MTRVQLALNDSNIDAAVDFYSKLFGSGPAKRRPGYANFIRGFQGVWCESNHLSSLLFLA